MWCHYNSILGTPEKQRLNLSVWAGREWCCLAEAQPVSLTCAWQLQAVVSQWWGDKTKSNRALQLPLPAPHPWYGWGVLPKNSVSSGPDQNESAAIRAGHEALNQFGDRCSGVWSFLLNTPVTRKAEQVVPEEVPLKRSGDCTSWQLLPSEACQSSGSAWMALWGTWFSIRWFCKEHGVGLNFSVSLLIWDTLIFGQRSIKAQCTGCGSGGFSLGLSACG